MASTKLTVKLEAEDLKEAKEKVSRLVDILSEAKEIIDSLEKTEINIKA